MKPERIKEIAVIYGFRPSIQAGCGAAIAQALAEERAALLDSILQTSVSEQDARNDTYSAGRYYESSLIATKIFPLPCTWKLCVCESYQTSTRRRTRSIDGKH